MKKLITTITYIAIMLVAGMSVINSTNVAHADDCEVASISFSNSSVSTSSGTSSDQPLLAGDTIDMTITTEDATDCVGKRFDLELHEYDVGVGNNDRVYNAQNQTFSADGSIYVATITLGDIGCNESIGGPCDYFVPRIDGLWDMDNFYDGSVRLYIDDPCGGNNSGCNNDAWWHTIHSGMGSQGGIVEGGSGCVIENVTFSPYGNQFNQGSQPWTGFVGGIQWTNFSPFILRGEHPTDDSFYIGNQAYVDSLEESVVDIVIETQNCRVADAGYLAIVIYEDSNIYTDDEAESSKLLAGVPDGDILNIKYKPGDEDCDNYDYDTPGNGVEFPQVYCKYFIKILQFEDPFVIPVELTTVTAGAAGLLAGPVTAAAAAGGAYLMGDLTFDNLFEIYDSKNVSSGGSDNTQNRISYYCIGSANAIFDAQPECSYLPWEIISTNAVGLDGQPIDVTPEPPTFDTSSECYLADIDGNSDNGMQEGYNPDCYEFLAPILTTTDAAGNTIFEKKINSKNYKLGNYVNQIFQTALGILMVLAVVMIVVAGIEYMTTEAISSKGMAKTRITNAVVGLILALGIFIILQTINPNLLNINFGNGIQNAYIAVTDAENGGDVSGDPGGNIETIPPSILSQVHCPGEGGQGAINQIATSFVGKSTYRFGAKGSELGEDEVFEWESPSRICENNVQCRTFCPDNSFCVDCSGFVNHVLKCSGKINSTLGGTVDIFDGVTPFSQYSESDHSIGGIPLEPGDLLGKPGHIGIYIGNGQVAESTAANEGRLSNNNIQIHDINNLEGRMGYIQRVKRYDDIN